MMFQLDVDIVMELQNLLPSYYDLIVPSVVIDELTTLKKIVNIKKTDHVDNLLLKFCNDTDVLCTNDKILRKRARKRNITVVYLRQHRYLEVDGYIKTNSY